MGLNWVKNKKSNMYKFIDATWNTVKGECPHDCSYCYMKRWGKLKPTRFDEKELKTDLGTGNFIFVGSSCDMFAKDIPEKWIEDTLYHCIHYNKNTYFFQSKDVERMIAYRLLIPNNSILCTTIETNRFYPDIMRFCLHPYERVSHFIDYVTIEPIMDFDLPELINLIKACNPKQVNIGADSENNNLPEPSKEKIIELIHELEKFTIVKQKKNLNRLLK